MVTAFSLWFTNVGLNGFTEYIIQKEQISKEEINSIFWAHLLIASILAILFSLFGYFLVGFYAEPALWGISVAMSVGFVVTAFYTSHLALLIRELKFTSIAVVNLVAGIISVGLALCAAFAGMNYWAVVIRQLAVPIFTAIGVWVICSWRPCLRFRLSQAFPGIKYAIQVYSIFTLGYFTRNIDKVLLGRLHGSATLGNYDRAYHLSSMPFEQLLSPLNSVALATLSRLKNEKEIFLSYFIKAVSMISFLGTITALVLTLLANELILVLLGPDWKDAGAVVMAFGPGIAANLVYGTHSWLHLSLGTPNRWLRWNLISSLVTIIAFIIAAPYGAVAMGIAYSIMAYILVLPSLLYAGRPIQLNVKSLLRPIWTYFAAALIIALFWLKISTSWIPLVDFLSKCNLIIRIISVAGIVSLLYFILVIIFQRSFRSIREILSFFKIFFARIKA